MEQVTTQERVARSMVSSNLKQQEYRSDLDYVIATGMVGQKHKEAVSILRYHLVGDTPTLRSVRGAAISITNKLNKKRGWGLAPKDIVRVADIAIKLYLNPVCPKCRGRRYQLIPGTPTLSTKLCHKCKGTGKRNAPDQDGEIIKDVVQVLTSIVDLATQAIHRKSRLYE